MAERALCNGALLCPLAVKVHHVVIHRVEVEAGAEHTLKLHGTVGRIRHDGVTRHDGQIFVNGVVELHFGVRRLVECGDLERFAVTVFVAQRRHAGQRRLFA